MTFNELYHLIKETDGITISLTDFSKPVEGYAVAFSKTGERSYYADEFTMDHLKSFINYNAKELYVFGLKLGAWKHEGLIYLDVIEIVLSSYFDAVEKGKERQQLAIYDIKKQETIFL